MIGACTICTAFKDNKLTITAPTSEAVACEQLYSIIKKLRIPTEIIAPHATTINNLGGILKIVAKPIAATAEAVAHIK